MNAKLLLTLILLFSMGTTLAQNVSMRDGKEGGNGQLTVIPRGETKPVPYEAVRAWETGKYLNFYRLPNINGNQEPREKFNKMYGVYALEWLALTKEMSPKLYNDLIKAAKNTSFRIINEFITWEHKPYPEGEVDYKKYEKAAFYNGEIILSTPVMDKVGPLNGKLTAEQNQGYIVFHELINAAYPHFSVAQRLEIGKAMIRAKILGDNIIDVQYNLWTIDDYFVGLLDREQDFLQVINEVIHYAKPDRANSLDFLRFVAQKFIYSNEKPSIVFSREVMARKVLSVKGVNDFLNQVSSAFNNLSYKPTEGLLSLSALETIAKEAQVPLYDYLDLPNLGGDGNTFRKSGNEYIVAEMIKQISKEGLERKIIEVISKLEKENLFSELYEALSSENNWNGNLKKLLSTILSSVKDERNLGYKKLINNAIERLSLNISREFLLRSYSEVLCKVGSCVDHETTKAYYKWRKTAWDVLHHGTNNFPFREDQRVISRNVRMGTVTTVNLKKQTLTILWDDKDKSRYFTRERDRDNPYQIPLAMNLDQLLFLK